MLPGYNHNIMYKNCVFHVQTEDSGVASPHIVTHLFVGGNIIDSRKTSYSHLVDVPDRDSQVMTLMQTQHKEMLKALIRGALDDKIAARSVNAATLNGPAPINTDAGAQNRTSLPSQAVAQNAEPDAAAEVTRVMDVNEFPADPASVEPVLDSDTVEIDTIFGKSVISDRPLDEVILTFLNQDLPKK